MDIVGEKVVLLIRPNNLSMAQKEKIHGTSSGTRIHRLPQPVKHQYGPVESGTHGVGPTVSRPYPFANKTFALLELP